MRSKGPCIIDIGPHLGEGHRLNLANPLPGNAQTTANFVESLGIGFVPIRKKGKLPGAVRELSYALEYGQDTIAIQEGAIGKGARVLLVDDLLATGGTAKAALDLLEQVGADVVETVFVAELIGLGGRERLAGRKMRSLLTYHVSE